MVRAEVSVDAQHGPIVTVTVDNTRVSVYLMSEIGVVNKDNGLHEYGLKVQGQWHPFLDAASKLSNA